MGDSMTCITFQYPVIRYDTSSIAGNIIDNSLNNSSAEHEVSNSASGNGATTGKSSNAPSLMASTTSHQKSSSSSSNTSGKTAEQFLHDKVALLCDSIAREWKCSIHSTPMKQPSKVSSQVDQQHHSNLPDKSKMDREENSSAVLRIIYSVTITGPFHAVMSCKNALIKRNPSQTVININTIRNIILTHTGEMKPIVKKRLDDLKQATGTQITCLESEKSTISTTSALPVILNIEIVGEQDAVERARLLCLALLDELFGLSVMQISVNPKYHALLAGRKREHLNAIMQQTETNFYFPIPFTVLNPAKSIQVAGNNVNSVGEADTYHNIYITGEADNIQEASKRYLDLSKDIESQIITKQVPCLHRKLDWLFTFRKEKIRKIMADNAVDVSFPAVGSASNMITVIGTQKNLVDRAIRSVKQVICDCYLASIQTGNTVESAEQFVRFCSEIGPTLTRSNSMSGVEIMINRNIVEIYGTDVQTKQAYQDLTSCEFIKIRDTKFQIELSLEHRDFINGKKNGKINRITKTSGCRISFQENPLDVNMMIDLYSAIPSCLLMGISMLEEELPAEMSFHIPETYHKRIIGVGGKNIQKIMKRFGVYVKFSNLEEYEQLGGYYENADNVICRTPSKNAENLRDLKSSIVEAVNATDLLETIDSLDGLPRQLSQWYCGENGKNIADAGLEFRVRVYLPDKESGIDIIGLEGPESALERVKAKLKDSIPLLSDFQVPGTSSVLNLLSSPEFLDLKKKLRTDFDMVVWIATSPPDTEFDFSFFLIHPKQITHEQYEEAKKMIVNLFSEQNVPFTHIARSESYANINTQVPYDSFQHFNSKLLAPVSGKIAASGPPSAGERDSSALRPGGAFGGIFSSSATTGGSVQDIRSLFDDTPTNGNSQGNSAPPGLLRNPGGTTPVANGGSDLRPKSNSVIARPVTSTNLRRPLTEKADFLRHSANISRPSLTMPDLATMSVSKSSSMTDIIQTTLNDTTPQPSIWGSSAFGKSLSSTAIIQDTSIRGSNFGKPHNEYATMVSPTDIEFDQKMEDQVQALDKQNSDESDRISRVLESIDHLKYLPNFIEHEIDYQTFLSLEDADLKELGIKALGSRKKILGVIKDLQIDLASNAAAAKQKSPDQRLINKGFEF